MKKKTALLLLTTALLLSACGSSTTTEAPVEDTTTVSTEETAETPEESTSESGEEVDDSADLNALGDVEVEKNLFTVELTIPADYVGETTQEELDATAKERGYKSITLNSDGSATYVMTKEQHKEMMDELAKNINDSLSKMCNSDDYPNFTQIAANDNFTIFTVTTKSTELDLNESFSVMAYYMYGGLYNIFNGTEADNIHVDFVNADSGEIISSSDSKDME